MLPDGRLAYRLRMPRRNGATHLVMTPMQCLARLASLIPPPRFLLQRLSGVFGPRSPLRAAVVPRGPARAGATATLPRAKKKKRIAKTPAPINDLALWRSSESPRSLARARCATRARTSRG
jgi:hypothetical protein